MIRSGGPRGPRAPSFKPSTSTSSSPTTGDASTPAPALPPPPPKRSRTHSDFIAERAEVQALLRPEVPVGAGTHSSSLGWTTAEQEQLPQVPRPPPPPVPPRLPPEELARYAATDARPPLPYPQQQQQQPHWGPPSRPAPPPPPVPARPWQEAQPVDPHLQLASKIEPFVMTPLAPKTGEDRPRPMGPRAPPFATPPYPTDGPMGTSLEKPRPPYPTDGPMGTPIWEIKGRPAPALAPPITASAYPGMRPPAPLPTPPTPPTLVPAPLTPRMKVGMDAGTLEPKANVAYHTPIATGALGRRNAEVTFTPAAAEACKDMMLEVDLAHGEVKMGGVTLMHLVPGAQEYAADFKKRHPGEEPPSWTFLNHHGVPTQPGGKITVHYDDATNQFSITSSSFSRVRYEVLSSKPPAPHKAEKIVLSGPELQEYREAERRFLPDLDAQLNHRTTVRNAYDLSNPKGKIPTLRELQSFCARMQSDPNIPHDYITDGCYARAHLFADKLRDQGFNVEKLYVHGDLAARNDLCDVRWGYHVAPLIFARDDDGKVKPVVVDLSFDARPMAPADWIKKFDQGQPVELEVSHRRQYGPPSTCGFTANKFKATVTQSEEQLAEYLLTRDYLRTSAPRPRIVID
jgi:hypothetical protein